MNNQYENISRKDFVGTTKNGVSVKQLSTLICNSIIGSPSDTYNCVYCNELPLTNDELDSVFNHYTNSVWREAVLTYSYKITYQITYKRK